MSRWRYHSILIRDLSIADSKLNAEAEKGWELVTVCMVDANTARVFFKAPAEVAASGPAEQTLAPPRAPE